MPSKSHDLSQKFLFTEMQQQATIEKTCLSYDTQGLNLYEWQEEGRFFCKLTPILDKKYQGPKAEQQKQDYLMLTRRQNLELLLKLIEKDKFHIRLSIENHKFNLIKWKAIDDLYCQAQLIRVDS